MQAEDREKQLSQAPHVSGPATPSPVRRAIWGIGAICVLATVALVFFLLRPSPRNGHAQEPGDDKGPPPSPYFRNWNKPDLAIVLSGQMIGYDQPCGCSAPQYGGLARRFEFIKSLKAKGWPVAAVDLGDIAMPKPNPHTLFKYETAMKALKLLDYSAIGLGQNEIKLPLVEALGLFALENPKPRLLAANLQYAKDDQVFGQVKPFEVVKQEKTTLGIVGLVGADIAESAGKFNDAKFRPTADALHESLAELGKQKADVVVLLYQGYLEPERGVSPALECAKYCQQLHQANPKEIPKVDVILCLTKVDNPPNQPEVVGQTQIVTLGHKAKHLGVIGVYKQPRELKYDLIAMGPEFETPEGKDDTNPVIALLEEYAKEVKRRDYAKKFPRTWHPIQAPVQFQNAKYVGSERCGECHQHAYKVWSDSGHSHAYDTLTKATRPSDRQFDGECLVCHTVGFQHPTGYLDAKNTERQNKKLLHVGCESCHGPGSLHANEPFLHPNLKKEMNPIKTSAEELDPKTPEPRRKELELKRLSQLDNFCIRCHDSENDVQWANVPLIEKWKKVEHSTPLAEAQALGMKKVVQAPRK